MVASIECVRKRMLRKPELKGGSGESSLTDMKGRFYFKISNCTYNAVKYYEQIKC